MYAKTPSVMILVSMRGNFRVGEVVVVSTCVEARQRAAALLWVVTMMMSEDIYREYASYVVEGLVFSKMSEMMAASFPDVSSPNQTPGGVPVAQRVRKILAV